MKRVGGSFALLILSLLATACTASVNSTSIANAFTSETPTYDCTYYSYFNDLVTCETASDAQCTSQYESFPNNTLQDCFVPVAGYESCINTPVTWDWIYTVYTACDTGSVDGSSDEIYDLSRSVVGCSSSVCNCTNPQVTEQTCSGASCSAYTPNPATEDPTPAPCVYVPPTPTATP
jgi:hypothetical protein